MKKRLLSWILTLTLVLSLVPGMTITASAWGNTSYDDLLNAISNQTLLDNRDGGSIYDDESGYFAIDGNKITNSDSRHAQIASGNSTKDFTFNNPPQSDSSCATFFRIVLKPSEASRMLTFKVNLPDNNGTYERDGVFRLFIFNSAVPYVDNSAQHSYRYAAYKKYDTTQGGMAIREFADYDGVSVYAQTSLSWAVNVGLIKGSNNKLMPHGDATRAQVAAILMRLIQNTKE